MRQASHEAEPSACAGVAEASLGPGWLAGPLVSAAGTASSSFEAVPGSYGVAVLRNGDASGQDQLASASLRLNGASVLSIAAGTPLAAAVVQLEVTNTLELTGAGVGTARAGVADVGAPPCSQISFTATRVAGGPQVVAQTFSLPQLQSAVLLIRNNTGPNNGAAAGVTGKVSYNGAVVAGRSQLRPGSPPVATAVELKAANTIDVLFEGAPAAGVEVSVFDADLFGPGVELTQPADLAVVSTSPVHVEGTASAGTVSVEVGGAPAALAVGVFTADVPLVPGANDIVAAARDQCGAVSRDCRVVALDIQPPVIAVQGVTDGDVTAGDLTISWTAQDEHLASSSATLDGAAFGSGATVTAEGDHTLVVTVADRGGLVATVSVGFAIDRTAPAIVVSGVQEGQCYASPPAAAVTATDPHQGSITARLDGNPYVSGTPVTTDGLHLLEVDAADLAGNESSATRMFSVDQAEGCGLEELPPDPATVAPPIDPTVATGFFEANEFLYAGTPPIQTGVAPGTIDPRRAAVLRGRVLDRDDAPISGVRVTVLDHPELGQTRSRADGVFDLAVNGGGPLTVRYEKAGLLEVQRTRDVPWNEFTWLPDVLMIPLDPIVTVVDLSGAGGMQVARGSVVTDEDGTRQATLLFRPGTIATMVLADGSTASLPTASVRATEYTVGPSGPSAMPGELPPTSAYTYAVELSADEARAAGAVRVDFSEPVLMYVENFVGFPAGAAVPTGFYDRDCGCWKGVEDAVVLALIGTSGGVALLDADGDGLADGDLQLAAIGVEMSERRRLAELYTAGSQLWRVSIPHFSPYDCNVPRVVPYGHQVVETEDAEPEEPDCNEGGGSVIACQSQSLLESVAVAGTPFEAVYRSDRLPGRRSGFRSISLVGTALSPGITAVRLEVGVGGLKFEQEFVPVDSLRAPFEWDGRDAYGRFLGGAQPYRVRIGYVFDVSYLWWRYRIGVGQSSFALLPELSGALIETVPARSELVVWFERTGTIGALKAAVPGGQQLAGWALDAHHAYDPAARVLLLGDGTRRSAAAVTGTIIQTAAGSSYSSPEPDLGDGGPATLAQLNRPADVAVGPDGSLYIADSFNLRIRRVRPDGIIETVAGGGDAPAPGYGDGGPATEATLAYPWSIAVGPDGTLFIADTTNGRIRHVDASGIIHRVAGGGTSLGDAVPATDARLVTPLNLAVAQDGTIYVADNGRRRVRAILPNGLIHTVAGGGSTPPATGGPWNEVDLDGVWDVAVGPDGSVYASLAFSGVVRITTGGEIIPVAGFGSAWAPDGGPAIDAEFGSPHGIAVRRDGTLLITDNYENVVWQVGQDGIIRALVGGGQLGDAELGDGGAANGGQLFRPEGIDVGPDGAIYIADAANDRIRRVTSIFPGRESSDIEIAAEGGREVYVFDPGGRHLRTVDALTGTTRLGFSYDAGRLAAVTDASGNVTAIERDPDGTPRAVVGPYGQRTELEVGADGYLATIRNPAGEERTFSYYDGGLMATAANARGYTSQFSYDDLGRLLSDEDPLGGTMTLARSGGSLAYEVAFSTAMGRTTRYSVTRPGDGTQRWSTQVPAGQTTSAVVSDDGTVSQTLPDGTTIATATGPDPRFGMAAAFTTGQTLRTPGGRVRTVVGTRAATLADPSDPYSLVSSTDTVRINGRTYRRTYDAATRALVSVSPAGRTSTATLDELGRPVELAIPGVYPVQLAYDARGHLESVAQGSRTSVLGYGADGFAATFTDPLLRTATFGRDLAGRITSELLPGDRTVGLGWDAGGNLTSVTPPGRPAHGFTYTPVNELDSYDPPPLDAGLWSTDYATDPDRQLDYSALPDGEVVDLSYEPSGRLDYLTTSRGTLDVAYDTAGRVQRLTAPGAVTTTYSYDGSLPTATVWTGPVAGTVTRTYDNDLRVRTIGVNGSNVTYTYDADKLLTSVSGAAAMTIARDPANGFVTGTTAGVVTTTTTYTPYGEVATFTARVSGTPRYGYVLERDDGGRITRKTDTILGVTTVFDYGYDLAGRLADVWTDGVLSAHYEYDANGNRLSRSDGAGATTTGVTDDQDRLISYGAAEYTFGRRGDLQQKDEPGPIPLTTQTTTYDYDAFGNLQGATLPGGAIVAYVVDGQNRRIGKRVNGLLRQGLLYDGQLRVVAELGGTNQVVGRFVYATRSNIPDLMVRSGVYRVLSDHLGSPRLVVNVSTGAIAQRLDYDEWGNVLTDTNPGWQPFGFAGGRLDRDLNLLRFGARDYDAGLGRWTTRDTITFAGGDTNLFAYCRNAPVGCRDPSGHVLYPYTPEIADALLALEQNPAIGPLVEALDNAPDLEVHIGEEVDPDRETASSIGEDTSEPWGVSLNPDYSSNTAFCEGLAQTTLEDVLAHELGHIYDAWQNGQAVTPQRLDESDATAIEWENASRDPGPIRLNHLPSWR